MSTFTVKVRWIGILTAESTESLGEKLWQACHGGADGCTFYGASEVGDQWPVMQDGRKVGEMSYNGRFWAA